MKKQIVKFKLNSKRQIIVSSKNASMQFINESFQKFIYSPIKSKSYKK